MNETPQAFHVDDTLTGQLRPIRRAVLSLGSNSGDRASNLQNAIDAILDAPGIWGLTVSPVYETLPETEYDGPKFLNAVLIVDTEMSGATLLERLPAILTEFAAISVVGIEDVGDHGGPAVDVPFVLIETQELGLMHLRLAD